jgi:hypothetical protein
MAHHLTFSFQAAEDAKQKGFAKSLFNLFGHRTWTQAEWDEVVDREVMVFLDPKQTRAQAAAKARKAAEKKNGKKPTKKAAVQEMDRLLGPRPRGASTRVPTIKGDGMGYSKDDGNILFKFPPEDAAERAAWSYKSRIKGAHSKYGAKGEMICEGIWCSVDGKGKNVEGFIDDELKAYYLLGAPVESNAPIQESKKEVAPEVVDDDDLGFDLDFDLPDDDDDDDDEAQAELAAVLKKTDARKKLQKLVDNEKCKRWFRSLGRGETSFKFNMDTFHSCVFAEAQIRAAIENRCNDKKDQEKSGRTYEEQKTHWNAFWTKTNKKARIGIYKNKKMKKAGNSCFEGMTKKEVLDTVFVLGFKRFLKAVEGKVQLTNNPIGKDKLAQILACEDEDDEF